MFVGAYVSFTQQDFAEYHPGGSLGKQLYLKVSDIYIHNELPMVEPDTLIKRCNS